MTVVKSYNEISKKLGKWKDNKLKVLSILFNIAVNIIKTLYNLIVKRINFTY